MICVVVANYRELMRAVRNLGRVPSHPIRLRGPVGNEPSLVGERVHPANRRLFRSHDRNDSGNHAVVSWRSNADSCCVCGRRSDAIGGDKYEYDCAKFQYRNLPLRPTCCHHTKLPGPSSPSRPRWHPWSTRSENGTNAVRSQADPIRLILAECLG